jgi:hypothetical protein
MSVRTLIIGSALALTVTTAGAQVVLYKENLSNPKSVGSAAWRIEQAAPGPGQKPDIVVRAEIEIPEQNISFRLSVRRNADKSLPASHMVEIAFRPDSPHGGISNIPGILMNYDGMTPGMPLGGVTVKAMPNSFLIGLSSVDADMQRNIEFLKGRLWFDIPVIYGDGKRAIIAVEKGPLGERVFAEAFAIWGQ